MLPIDGSGVLLTGAAGPVGQAVAGWLRERGARVLATDSRGDLAALGALAGCPSALVWSASELDSEEACRKLVDGAVQHFGRLDTVVHAAPLDSSCIDGRPLHELREADYRQRGGSLLRSTFLINQAALRHMIPARSGQIINLCASSGRSGRAFQALYSAAQAAIIGLSESIAEEARQFGVRVQVVLADPHDSKHAQSSAELPPERVAQAVGFCLQLPLDASCNNLVVKPLRIVRRRSAGQPVAAAVDQAPVVQAVGEAS